MSLRRPRRKPGVNRELLLEAGLLEFGLLGYHGASTVTIAARADVPQPNLYANFATKQDLFLACSERVGTMLVVGPTKPTATVSRFLYQVVAALGDSQLSPTLTPFIVALRQDLGERRFCELLATGASALLEGEVSIKAPEPTG